MALDLVGAVVPLLLSALVIVFLFLRSGRKVSLRRTTSYSVLIILLGTVIAAEFTAPDFFLGGVEVSAWSLYISLFIAASVQLWRLDHRPGFEALLRSYVIGTFALILSNLFRTFAGVVNASPQVIGAGGAMDAVFLAGPYLALFYMMATMAFVIWLGIRERWSHGEIM